MTTNSVQLKRDRLAQLTYVPNFSFVKANFEDRAAVDGLFQSEASLNLLDIQPGDVPGTCADVDDLVQDVGFRPTTPVEARIGRFVDWYREYYR